MGSPGATIITDLTGLAVEVDDTEIDWSNLLPTAFFIIIFKVVKNDFKSFPKEQFMYNYANLYNNYAYVHLSFHEKMLQYQILL